MKDTDCVLCWYFDLGQYSSLLVYLPNDLKPLNASVPHVNTSIPERRQIQAEFRRWSHFSCSYVSLSYVVPQLFILIFCNPSTASHLMKIYSKDA